ITSVSSVKATFESWRINHPNVTWDNVAGPEGAGIRELFMTCPGFCLLPWGTSLQDVDGLATVITYGLHTILALCLSCLYLGIQWCRVRNRTRRRGQQWSGVGSFHRLLLFPLPRHDPEDTSSSAEALDEIFTSFFDASLTVTIPLLIVLLYWLLSNPSAKIYLNVFSNLFAALSFGSLTVSYTLIGANSRHSTRRFVVCAVGLVVFVVLSVLSITYGRRLINHEARPFYATLGVDCPKLYPKLVHLQESAFTTDGWHIFTLLTFVAYLCYFVLRGILGICYRGEDVVPRRMMTLGIFLITLLHGAICIAAVAVMVRLLRYRSTFGHLNEKITGQPWDGNVFGFGQILILFVWMGLVVSTACYLVLKVSERWTSRDKNNVIEIDGGLV
ncbi:hypothetical protein LTR72_010007, partial [Exophiala xenobiotica]